MTMSVNKIKQILKEYRIYQWEVANVLGIGEFTLSRWLRSDLSPEKQERILQAIKSLLMERNDESSYE